MRNTSLESEIRNNKKTNQRTFDLKENNREDPATTSPGYENTQAISDFIVTLHRDHIIPYEKINTFLDILLQIDELKFNLWIEAALNKYHFNQSREKEKIYSEAINDQEVKDTIIPVDKGNDEIYLLYKQIFDSASIVIDSPNNIKILAIIRYIYELNNLNLQDDTLNQLKDIKECLRAKKIYPSTFFSDDSALYINVESVIARYKRNSLIPTDEVIIRRATGWMPGNVFLAPYPKPQDKGNIFDCTVAAANLPSKLIHVFCDAYKTMNEFEKTRKSTTAKAALNSLSIIAKYRENCWPLTYKNWKYYSTNGHTFFYPKQIVNINSEKIEDNKETPDCSLLSERFLREHNDLSK